MAFMQNHFLKSDVFFWWYNLYYSWIENWAVRSLFTELLALVRDWKHEIRTAVEVLNCHLFSLLPRKESYFNYLGPSPPLFLHANSSRLRPAPECQIMFLEGLPGGVLVPLFPSNIALCSHVPTHKNSEIMLSIYYIRIFSYCNFSNSVPLFPKIG